MVGTGYLEATGAGGGVGGDIGRWHGCMRALVGMRRG
jgi:hypothetical protein